MSHKNFFSFESHESQTAEELPETGAVEVADTVTVETEIVPSEDVVEAGDDIAQATPDDVIESETVQTPEGDVVTETTETTDAVPADVVSEIETLTTAGETAHAAKVEIVEQAAATDVNGNAITEEQAVENEEQEQVNEEVNTEEEEASDAKDINGQVAEIEANAEDELGNALAEDSEVDGGEDGAATDDTSTTDGDGAGDLDMDTDLGSDSEPAGADTINEEDDDTPLEGADLDNTPASDSSTDIVDGDSTGDTEETLVDTDEPTGDSEVVTEETEVDTTGDLEDTSVAPVEEEVAEQNEAAEQTAEAASADVDQTEFIADETPEQHGELTEQEQTVDEVIETEADSDVVPNDGEPVIAEAEPAVQVETDVSTGNGAIPDEVVDPQENVEPLAVEVTEDLTPKEVDGEAGEGATVEESISDQQAEELDVINEDTVVTDDEVVETLPVEEEVVETGEIEETDEPAELEEGQIDIPDVDTETTEEEVDDAIAEADEVEAEADAEEADAEEGDKTIEELQREKESLEEFRVILEHSIATESYSPQLLAYINTKIEPLRNALNGLFPVDQQVKGVSLESYTSQDLDLAYTASLESVRGMLSRATTITHALTQKVERWWGKSMVEKVNKRADAVNKELDHCLVKLKDSDYTSSEIKGIGAYLSHADGNFVKAVSDDLKIITEISGKGLKASETLQGYMVKALNDITQAATPAEATKVSNAVADFKNTKTAFPDAAFRKGLLGGHKLVVKDAPKGDNLKEKILYVGRTAVPVVVKEGKGGDTTAKLSKGDIANLLKLGKAYVAVAKKLAETTGDRAADNISKIRLTRERALPVVVENRVRSNDEVAVDAVATSLTIVTQAHNDLYKFITKHCFDVAEALCGISKKATK